MICVICGYGQIILHRIVEKENNVETKSNDFV